MPEISRFYGIVIRMYFDDHGAPHFHAFYGGQAAAVDITGLELLEGALPKRAMLHVLEWAFEHRRELLENWELARHGTQLKKIAPLE